MKKAVDDGTDVSAAVKSFDAAPFMRLLNAAELMPGNASRTYLELERESEDFTPTMDIKVLGTGCANCKNTIALIEQVAKDKGVPVTLARSRNCARSWATA
jgi:hypothetical protein